MKRLFITFSFIALSIATSLAEDNFDFSAVCSSGQTLYYTIVAPNAVEITYPNKNASSWEYKYSGYSKPDGHLTIPDTIINNAVKYTVKSIGMDAFQSCTDIISVKIPNTVTDIDYEAFATCENLKLISIPKTVNFINYQAFNNNDITIYCELASQPQNWFTSYNSYGTLYTDWHSKKGTVVWGVKASITDDFVFYATDTTLRRCGVYKYVGNDTDVEIPSKAYFDGNEYAVTSIGYEAFVNYTDLLSVTIPESVSSIGQSAFSGCEKLTSVMLPKSLKSIGAYAFESSGLTSVMIGDSVIDVAGSSFAYCENLKNVFIPKSVKYVRQNAFSCTANIYCEVSEKPIEWDNKWRDGNDGDVIWNCKRIGDYVYAITSNIEPYTAQICEYTGSDTKLTVPSMVTIDDIEYSITEIAGYAFNNCYNLKSVTIPNSFTNIGEASFSGCSSLESITLPFVGTTINSSYFKNQFAFGYIFGEDSYSGGIQIEQNTLEIGNGYTSEHHRCYYIPISLKEVIITGSSTIPYSVFQNCSNLTSITIPNTVTSIETNAFLNCYGLTSITIPNSVLNIGQYAFSNCTGLSSITIPNSVLSIGQYAFSNCTSLTSVIIPKSVSRIEDAAFYSCVLQSITIEKPTPPVLINADAFQSNIPIYIPCGSLSAYQSANNWGNYIYAEKLMHKLEISSTDVEKGIVEVLREPTCDKSAIIQATAESGYKFYQWSDGNKSNLRYITVTQDTALVAYFVVDEVEAEIASANTAQGTVSNLSGTYHYNDEIEISATANYGYTFEKWSDGETANPRTVVLRKDTVIRAEFAVNQYTITLKTNNAERGSVSGDGSFNYLTNNKITATANTGYVFAKWEDGNTSNPRTVSLTCDTTFMAVFVPAECQLQVATSDEVKGFVSNSSGTYYYKDEVEISATANYGYHFTTWSDGVTKNPRTIQLIKDTVIEAQFAVNQYSIQLQSNDTNMGSANGAGSFDYLSTNKISATPKTGFVFHHWSDENPDNPRTITLTRDTAFTAVFVPDEVNVEVKSADTEHGTVTELSGVYHFNEKIIISAIAVPHYHFVSWSDGNRQNPREVLLRGDTVLTATFGIDTFSVAAKCDTTMGAVSGAGLYSYGSAAKVEAKPAAHHHFVQWKNGAVQTTQEFVVEHDTTFEAVFAIDRHSVALAASDSLCGAVSGAGSYDYGASVQLQATPAANCYFTGWSDGVTTNPRTLIVEGDTNIVAEFGKLQTVNIMVAANDSLRGTVAGTGSYVVGNNATLLATASAHYLFEQWSDGRTDNPRTVRVIADATYTAVFVPMQYNIILSQNNADMGMVSGSGVYSYGERVSCLAKPYPNYHFVQWSNGETANPYEFVVEEDKMLTAYFAAGAVTAIGNESATQPTIYAVGNTIVVENATDEICVYDAMGKLICRDAIHRVRAELRVNAAGVYIVKTGNVVMRVVVE